MVSSFRKLERFYKNASSRYLCSVAAVKSLPVHIVSTVISKITRYLCHAVMVTYIRAIRSTFFGGLSRLAQLVTLSELQG
jgi:hypothetical protein